MSAGRALKAKPALTAEYYMPSFRGCLNPGVWAFAIILQRFAGTCKGIASNGLRRERETKAAKAVFLYF